MNKLILIFCLFAFSSTFAQVDNSSQDHGKKFRTPPPPPPPPRSKEDALRWHAEQQAKRNEAKLNRQQKQQEKAVHDRAPKEDLKAAAAESAHKKAKEMKVKKQKVETAVQDRQPKKNLKIEKSVNTLKKAEKNLAKPKAAKVVKQVADPRKPTSVTKPFNGGMHSFKKDCTMYSKPNTSSSSAGSVSKGKKLWIDPHNNEWHKAYKKSGTVYIHNSCI